MPKPKQAPKPPKTGSLWLMLMTSAMIVGVLAYYAKFTPAGRVPEDQKRASRESAPIPRGEDPTQVKTIQSVTPRYEDNRLKFDSKSTSVPTGENAVVFAVNQFLKSNQVTPKDAKLLKATIDGSTATLDFNAAFETTYGTEDEHTVLDGILLSVGQFKTIERVVFLIEGKPLETLGNVDLTTPQPVLRSPQEHPDVPDLP